MTNTLYRVFDSSGELLYVGASINVAARLGRHAHLQTWWGDVARIDLEHFPTRAELLSAESAAIQIEGPKYNWVHSKHYPWSEKPHRQGRGTIFQRSSDGRWIGGVELPAGKDGKRRQKRFSGKSKEEVERKLAALLGTNDSAS